LGFGFQFPGRFVIKFRLHLEKIIGQKQHVFLPFPQGRHFEADNVQPIKKVFAELAPADHLFQVPKGGGDNSDIHGNGRGAAERNDGLILDAPKQFGLDLRLEFPDFIKKEGAGVGGPEEAHRGLIGAGKGAFDMAEQLRLKQRIPEGGAIDGDKRFGSPWA